MIQLPFFVEAIWQWAVKKWGGRSEAVTNGIAIFMGIFVIFLAICSVTTVVHNSGTKDQYCTTLLGEKTSCD
jgi:hypothetical protein